MPIRDQLYAPHPRGHGLPFSDPDDVDPEIFSAAPDPDDLEPYRRDRRTVDGDERIK